MFFCKLWKRYQYTPGTEMDSILKRTMYECSNIHYLHCFFLCGNNLYEKSVSTYSVFIFDEKKRLFKSRLNRHMNETANESGQSNIRYN